MAKRKRPICDLEIGISNQEFEIIVTIILKKNVKQWRISEI